MIAQAGRAKPEFVIIIRAQRMRTITFISAIIRRESH
jgi:hypothetical protein